MAKKNIKELRVIGVPWHVGHQYELAKLFGEYDLLMNHYRTWGDVSRPRPENMKDVLTFKKTDYDLAILHVDQQCTQPEMNKYKLFTQFKELTEGMPRVIINHMTPFDDRLETDEVIARMKELTAGIPMITNSKEAAKQWGWGTPIIHGIDPDEWFVNPKEPRVITSLSPEGMATAYRRELLHATIDILKEKGIEFIWIQVDRKMHSFDEYRDFISRSLIYFNATWQSPMPRSRTEAMMSGCCVVSTKHHDWGNYIENGVNGFLVPDNPTTAANLIADLLLNRYQETVKIGLKGREFAMKEFHINRWKADWEAFLRKEGVLQ